MSADLIVGDTGSIMRINCKKKSDGTAINLTGASVRIGWRNEDDDADVTRAMTIGDAVNGIAEYKFVVADLYGNFMKFEFEITDSGGEILTGLTVFKQIVREPIVA